MTKAASKARKPSPFSLLRQIYAEVEVSPEKIRGFGKVMFVVLGLLVPGFLYWRSGDVGPVSAVLLLIGILLGLVSRLRPDALHGIYRGWMSLAVVLGLFMTKVIITLVFFGMMLPIGFIRQRLVKDPLQMKPDPGRESYWIPHAAAEPVINPKKYEKQY
ncbi:MAG: SxtJ family membrane protein [Cyclonatronaceae bacterium]